MRLSITPRSRYGSRALSSRGALIVTVIIVLIAIFELSYARAMQRRAVLQ